MGHFVQSFLYIPVSHLLLPSRAFDELHGMVGQDFSMKHILELVGRLMCLIFVTVVGIVICEVLYFSSVDFVDFALGIVKKITWRSYYGEV